MRPQRKRPKDKPRTASAVVTPAEREKPLAGNVAQQGAASAPTPATLVYSPNEKFRWLQGAAFLETTTSHAPESKNPDILDYRKVRQSVSTAETRIIGLMRQEYSIDDLDKKRNEKGSLSIGGLRVDEKKKALRIVETTGSVTGGIVRYAIEKARQDDDGNFFIKLGRALELKERPSEIDYERISLVARFLVDNWCGDNWFVGAVHPQYEWWLRMLVPRRRDATDADSLLDKSKPFFFMPPLCFFDEERLVEFCALVLGEGSDTTKDSIGKWVSRLRLARANNPKITQIKRDGDGRICFGCDVKSGAFHVS